MTNTSLINIRTVFDPRYMIAVDDKVNDITKLVDGICSDGQWHWFVDGSHRFLRVPSEKANEVSQALNKNGFSNFVEAYLDVNLPLAKDALDKAVRALRYDAEIWIARLERGHVFVIRAQDYDKAKEIVLGLGYEVNE